MIELIKIQSLAVFDDASIEFKEGLNCITGETGTGKSLVIKAFTILMGARVSGDLIRTGKDRAVVEALFNNNGREIIIRRELSNNGRSRCYINGELSTSEKLSRITSSFLHIYGQHEYQDLLSQREQMRILEESYNLKRDLVVEAQAIMTAALQKYNEIKSMINAYNTDRQNLEFTLSEIKAASVHEGLEAELKEELDVALSSQELKESSKIAYGMLYSDNRSVIDILSDAKNIMQKMSTYDKRISLLVENLQNVSVQVEEIASGVRGFSEGYDYDEAQIELLESRLHTLRDLKKKYSSDEAGLLLIMDDAKTKLSLIEDSSFSLDEADRRFKEAVRSYHDTVEAFLSQRLNAGELFSESINNDLAGLGMPGTVFRVVQIDKDSLKKSFEGEDMSLLSPGRLLEGEFMISTNIGLNMISLARAASGGELSRIMLAIKARQGAGFEGTMIFDEIDSGIGGQAAIMIAEKLKAISGKSQAIVVTHLHQVASAADTHLVVEKRVKNRATFSSVMEVNGESRVTELARMMGGETPGEALVKHARKLVKSSS